MQPQNKPKPAIFTLNDATSHYPIAGISVLERNVRAALAANAKPCVIVSENKPPARIMKINDVKWTKNLKTAEKWVGRSALRFEGNHMYDRMLIEKMVDGSIHSTMQSPIEWRLPIESSEHRIRAKKYLYESLKKKNDGIFTKYVARHISILITCLVAKTPITPNHITAVCFIFGMTGAWFFAQPDWSLRIWGGFLFLLHFILDNCDGELSRLRFEASKTGGLMDFWSDNIVHASIFVACGIGLWREGMGEVPIILGAIAALFSVLSATKVAFYISKHEDNGPMMSGVMNPSYLDKKRKRLVKVLDLGAGRDFVLIVFGAALANKLDWLLWMAAIGAPLYFVVLIYTSLQPGHKSLNHTR